jgi:uncharacterized protein (TIGR02588 family)
MTERRKPAKSEGDTPLLEWICGGVGALLFLAAVVLLVGEGMKPATPPDISGRVIGVEQVASGWRVTVEVRNAGDAAVDVRLEVNSGGETRDMTVDFLPPQATRTGGVYFEQRPISGSIRVALTSFLTF